MMFLFSLLSVPELFFFFCYQLDLHIQAAIWMPPLFLEAWFNDSSPKCFLYSNFINAVITALILNGLVHIPLDYVLGMNLTRF